jgi:molybdopterin synthase catalytic subunit
MEATAVKTVGALVADILSARDRSDELAGEKKRIDAESERLEKELSDLMDEQGLQSVKSTDGRTLYKSRDLFVSVCAANRSAVVAACQELGLTDLIKTEVPTTTLKSHIREWMGDMGEADQIPEQLRALVHVHEEYSIRVRKA